MGNTNILKSLIDKFSLQTLSDFMRSANRNFRPQDRSFDQYLRPDDDVSQLQQVGQINFSNESQLVIVAGFVNKELSSRSGKKNQYNIAKKILKDEFIDAGIFVFYDEFGHFRFSLVLTQYLGQSRTFSNYRRFTYFVSPEIHNRTFLEQVGQAEFESIEEIRGAFSVEKVTKDFFKKYKEIFSKAEKTISLDWDDEQKRLYTQRFFNRVLFIAFVEQKGWLKYNGKTDYLQTLFNDFQKNNKGGNFHQDRLNTLFFQGLNTPKSDKKSSHKDLIGEVPYLNGGLFEKREVDDEWFYPDEVINKLLSELIYRFNFTVAESTPLDIEVAVDPEMLGKMFEELVTGRHESGSYYTPKRIVSFMCRESIKYYLRSVLEEEDNAISGFVDINDPSGLHDPEKVLNALRTVKVCDPACGSGAYLLGLLQELLTLRGVLFASRNLDPRTVYERKLEIIQNNLYGVDIDSFAVNIAQLRLWLSLIVDYEGENPPPLPNLEFKIEVGDSLTAPDPSGGLQPDMFRYNQVQNFLRLKNEFLTVHSGSEKKQKLIEEIRNIRNEISEWAHPESGEGFDWAVDFVEIFAPELEDGTISGKLSGVINAVPGQMELIERKRDRGFDIVLTNPPYIRQEILDNEFGPNYKERLTSLYPKAYTSTADLYVAFYARAHQMLSSGGVACFISSNKWLRAGYGEKLRGHLLDKQKFHLVVDFGELPVFKTASTFPAIFLWQKQARENTPTEWVVVKDLNECYEKGVRNYIDENAEKLPAEQFGKDKPGLVSRHTAKKLSIMENSGPRLIDYVNGDIYYGIKTGLNEAFIIDNGKKQQLISQDPNSEEIIKPLLRGDNVRHYEVQYREEYLIWTYIGVPIDKYPAVFSHLQKFEERAKNRWDQGEQWWELRACDYYDEMMKPKIIWADISKNPRFYLDKENYFIANTGYLLPLGDWFLLSIFNSGSAWDYLKTTASILGDEEKGGRVRMIYQYMENLPIPEASKNEKTSLGKLAEENQMVHMQRRKEVERFLYNIGTSPTETTSRNSLEKPWLLKEDQFKSRARRYGNADVSIFRQAKEHTSSLTKKIQTLENEIDTIVKKLYGLD